MQSLEPSWASKRGWQGVPVFLSDRIYVMSPSPGQIISVEDIELKRPRSREVMVNSNVLDIKNRLLNQLLQPVF